MADENENLNDTTVAPTTDTEVPAADEPEALDEEGDELSDEE